MKERRHNWKEFLGREAQERTQKRLALLDQLEEIRTELHVCGRDFKKRDEVSLRYRETIAKLATI